MFHVAPRLLFTLLATLTVLLSSCLIEGSNSYRTVEHDKNHPARQIVDLATSMDKPLADETQTKSLSKAKSDSHVETYMEGELYFRQRVYTYDIKESITEQAMLIVQHYKEKNYLCSTTLEAINNAIISGVMPEGAFDIYKADVENGEVCTVPSNSLSNSGPGNDPSTDQAITPTTGLR